MSTDDLVARRAELAARWRQLWQLDVVEQAECMVRDLSEHLLLDQVDILLRELDAAAGTLALLRSADDLTAICAAEERLCALQRHADTMLQQLHQHRGAIAEAQNAYITSRWQLQQLIGGLARRIGGDHTAVGENEEPTADR